MSQIKNIRTRTSAKTLLALLTLTTGLVACGNKEAKPGQALASVNGEEITVLQLNEELQRANVQAAQQEAASKQLLESLIDRQLLLNEAVHDKLDRDPKVLQSIERAKAMILSQTYLQKRIGNPTKPTPAEVEAYFKQQPQFFSNRKQFDLKELVLASKDMSDPLQAAIEGAKSLDDVAQWMEQHQVKFGRAQLSRSSAELPPELTAKLLAMPLGKLFIIKEGERSLLVTIADIKEAPVRLEAAAPQIEQFLANKKSKEAADAELARLRSNAKISYLNGRKPPEKAGVAGGPAGSKPSDAATERGVAGLK